MEVGVENATDSFLEFENTAEELQHAEMKIPKSKQVLTKHTENLLSHFVFIY